MAFKMVPVFLAVLLVAQVSCFSVERAQGFADVQEIRLEDVNVGHISNPFYGVTISIPHLVLDKLEVCNVIFPNGVSYEVFPNSNLPNSVEAGNSVFNNCMIGFRNASPNMSGSYELTALITHHDGSRTLQRQRFNVNIKVSED